MSTYASILLALYLISPLVLADIFKCNDGKGNDKYQNFPCPIDSIGSKATAVPPKEATVKPALQADMAPLGSLSNRREPQPGMKMNDVRAAWGAPKSTEVIKSVETWYYDGPSGTTRGVRFDRSGTVLLVTETVESKQSDSAD